MAILSNKIALITGASRGIGQAVAKRFAAEGAQVILVARSKAGLIETDDAIQAAGGHATLVEADVSDATNIELLAKNIAERFGRLDILVANAGQLGELSPMAHQDPKVWHKTFDINLHTNFELIRWFDPLLKLSECPRALFVTSGVATKLPAYWGAYAVTKAALDAMVKVYAEENAKTPLRVNLVSPGEVNTRMHAQAFPGKNPDDYASPDSITDIFVTLASDDCIETGKIFNAQ